MRTGSGRGAGSGCGPGRAEQAATKRVIKATAVPAASPTATATLVTSSNRSWRISAVTACVRTTVFDMALMARRASIRCRAAGGDAVTERSVYCSRHPIMSASLRLFMAFPS